MFQDQLDQYGGMTRSGLALGNESASTSALRTELAIRDRMLDASVDCIKIIDVDGRVLHMNLPGRIALGVSDAEAAAGYGMKWLSLLPAEVRDRGRHALRRARAGLPGRFAGMSVRVDNGIEKVQHWDNILTPLKDAQDNVTAILCVSRDITLQREAERRMRYASERDALTGLLNRRTFRSRLAKSVTHARAKHNGVGLILIDLDHFKTVNDTLGHTAGDRLLQVFAQRLDDCLPESAFAGRLGGDEFGVGIACLTDTQEIRDVAEVVTAQLDAPILYDGHPLSGGMSLGCAVGFDGDADEPTLMRQADIALNDAKARGRGGIQSFDSGMQEAVDLASGQVALARGVLSRGDVVAFYQPKVRLDSGELIGFEAQLRWRAEDGTLRPSSEIAEAFNHYELAAGLAVQMHRRVLTDMQLWRRHGLGLVPVAISVSKAELLSSDFSEPLLAGLCARDIAPELIELGVSQPTLRGRGQDIAKSTLRELGNAGVHIVLDDFGTANSSLTELLDNQVSALKIAGPLVRRLAEDPHLASIVKGICAVGTALDLEIVGTGIETEEQRTLLMSSGCLTGQGPLLGPTLTPRRAAEVLGGSRTGVSLAS